MKHEAPPVLGELEFSGLVNELVLVEVDPDSQLLETLRLPLNGKINIIFSSTNDLYVDRFEGNSTVIYQAKSVYEVYKFMTKFNVDVDYFVIDRIDMFDETLSPKEKGAQQSAYIQMCASPKNLRSSNLIVTSANQETTLRKKANKYLNLRLNQNQ